jgi:predicted ArsR family transcriptional regulator
MHEAPHERVEECLRASGEPATARTVAGSLGIHVTTARYHLDQLAAQGRVSRRTATGTPRRGRPEFEYTLVDAEAARLELLSVLAGLVERREGSREAIAAGEAWARRLSPTRSDAKGAIVDELASRGFAPIETATGLDLHDCPFREAAQRSPSVVCGLHLGLTRGLAEGASGEWDVTLEPFVTDSLCRVGLTRVGDGS